MRAEAMVLTFLVHLRMLPKPLYYLICNTPVITSPAQSPGTPTTSSYTANTEIDYIGSLMTISGFRLLLEMTLEAGGGGVKG